MAIIVIAEDEYLLASELVAILEDDNHEVRMAPHGQAALKLVRAHRPDLVITDFMMPLMTGLELAQAIRADADLARTPIVLVSGAQGDIGREHPDAFDAVLDKPYDIKRLLAIVQRLVST
jgi:CheY-like chemotaxis protein